MHPGRIHGYVERKYRERGSCENSSIIIVVILCVVARTRGTQYTKRLLPDVLIPRSVIRLDYLLSAVRLPEEERSTERVCELIGCLDPRTARDRIRRLGSAISEVSLDLARLRAATPELGDIPESSPDTPPQARMVRLYEAHSLAHERAGAGSFTPALPSLRHLLQTAMGKRTGGGPSTSESSQPQPP